MSLRLRIPVLAAAALVASLLVTVAWATPARADDELTPDEMVALFDNADLADVVVPDGAPLVTGDPAADAHIAALAEARGYRLRPQATGPFDSSQGVPLHPSAAESLGALRAAAAADGVSISMRYGYRSVELQRTFFLRRIAGWSNASIAAGSADGTIDATLQWVAAPGYSKHHTGFVIDVNTSDDYRWLSVDNYANAKRFGWLPSYPPGASAYGPNPEPWEFTFVGVDALASATGGCGEALSGDWDGDGTDSVSIRRAAQLLVNNALAAGPIERVVVYGTPQDDVLVGDWNGDDIDTLAVRRGRQFLIKETLTSGAADTIVSYGRPDDVVLVGDWNGDGVDTLAARRGREYFIKLSVVSGVADRVIAYGQPDDEIVVGDWDGDGADTLAVRRGNVFYVRDSLSSGVADRVFSFGRPDDVVMVGDWDGDGIDTFALRRGDELFLRNDFRSGAAEASFRLDVAG